MAKRERGESEATEPERKLNVIAGITKEQPDTQRLEVRLPLSFVSRIVLMTTN